jgi:hypothetical protein
MFASFEFAAAMGRRSGVLKAVLLNTASLRGDPGVRPNILIPAYSDVRCRSEKPE